MRLHRRKLILTTQLLQVLPSTVTRRTLAPTAVFQPEVANQIHIDSWNATGATAFPATSWLQMESVVQILTSASLACIPAINNRKFATTREVASGVWPAEAKWLELLSSRARNKTALARGSLQLKMATSDWQYQQVANKTNLHPCKAAPSISRYGSVLSAHIGTRKRISVNRWLS